MSKVRFLPPSEIIIPPGVMEATFEEIYEEPMLVGASWNYAYNHGGPLTGHVMDVITQNVKKDMWRQGRKGLVPLIDTRSVLLMPGQYATLPRWHVPCSPSRGWQFYPDLQAFQSGTVHYDCVLCSDPEGPEMEYLKRSAQLDIDKGSNWKTIQQQLPTHTRTRKISHAVVAVANASTLRRPLEAEVRCWQYIFRLYFYPGPAENTITTKSHVYDKFVTGQGL